MTDLRVVAQIPARSGSEEVVREALTTLAAATREHQGCLSYELFESAASPGVFVTVESWTGQADLDAHLQSEDIATAMAAAGEHLGGEIAIHPLRPVTG
jgi:quinol monooxygenase YgiN